MRYIVGSIAIGTTICASGLGIVNHVAEKNKEAKENYRRRATYNFSVFLIELSYNISAGKLFLKNLNHYAKLMLRSLNCVSSSTLIFSNSVWGILYCGSFNVRSTRPINFW